MRPISACILAVAGLATAFFAGRDAAAAYWLSAAPDQAPDFVAKDPQIALARTDKALTGPDAVEPAVVRTVAERARAAIAAEPLNPMAVRQFALAEQLQMRGDYRKTLALAERLSRRDAPTQIGLLRVASSAGDYRGFVDHFDKLVSTNPRTGASLYGVMGQSLADPQLRQHLTRLTNRPWFTGFLVAVSRDREVDPAPIAAFLAESRIQLDDRATPAITALIGRLLLIDDYAGAHGAALASGKTKPAALDDFALRASNADPAFAPLTWRIFATRAVEARFGEENELDVELQPDSAAPIAERVTRLRPGGYDLTWTVAQTSAAMGTLVEWRMYCGARANAPQAWINAAEIRADRQPQRAAVTIPAGCPVQRWRLSASSGTQQAPAAFAISDAQLKPAP